MPLIEFIGRVLSISLAATRIIQSLGNSFIWKGTHEQVTIVQQYRPITEGGLGLTNCRERTKALFTKTILKFLNSKETYDGRQATYLLDHSNPFKNNTNKYPFKEKALPFFKTFLKILEYLKTRREKAVLLNLNTKEIYELLVEKTCEPPKILERNPGKEYSKIFKNIASQKISPTAKEHLYRQAHNILPTKFHYKKKNKGRTGEMMTN